MDNEIEKSNENDDVDEMESLFQQKFAANIDGNKATLAPIDHEKSFDLDDSNCSELEATINRFHPNNDDILVVSTPNLKQRKFRKQKLSESYSESYRSDDESESISFKNTGSSEIEDAKRYFEIYSTPRYRWSMDMIPNSLMNFANKSQSDESSKKSKPPLFKQLDISQAR
ncbi:hypothetical protein BLA29_009119, partial [Euroglyphus maynei]